MFSMVNLISKSNQLKVSFHQQNSFKFTWQLSIKFVKETESGRIRVTNRLDSPPILLCCTWSRNHSIGSNTTVWCGLGSSANPYLINKSLLLKSPYVLNSCSPFGQSAWQTILRCSFSKYSRALLNPVRWFKVSANGTSAMSSSCRDPRRNCRRKLNSPRNGKGIQVPCRKCWQFEGNFLSHLKVFTKLIWWIWDH